MWQSHAYQFLKHIVLFLAGIKLSKRPYLIVNKNQCSISNEEFYFLFKLISVYPIFFAIIELFLSHFLQELRKGQQFYRSD